MSPLLSLVIWSVLLLLGFTGILFLLDLFVGWSERDSPTRYVDVHQHPSPESRRIL